MQARSSVDVVEISKKGLKNDCVSLTKRVTRVPWPWQWPLPLRHTSELVTKMMDKVTVRK